MICCAARRCLGPRLRDLLRAAFAIALPVTLAACHPGAARARAEAAQLRRQAAGLRALLEAADQGALFSSEHVTIGIEQDLVRDLLQAQLPLERVVLERFHFRLSRADVKFESSQSLIAISGRVHAAGAPEAYAELTLVGGLDEIGVDPHTGTLTARVALDRVELDRVGTGALDAGWTRTLLESLGGSGLGALGEAVPPLQLPMRLDRTIESRGVDDGVLVVPPARLTVQAAVKRVLPMAGRLWISLEITTVRS
jgi:hypothetical protein